MANFYKTDDQQKRKLAAAENSGSGRQSVGAGPHNDHTNQNTEKERERKMQIKAGSMKITKKAKKVVKYWGLYLKVLY